MSREALGRARLATRLTFFAAGFGMACWAPLVPFAKARAGLDDGQLGLLLLCLGAGSMLGMPLSGALVARLGSRVPIVAGGLVLCAMLPLLAGLSSGPALGATLALFGAALGLVDVAMNVHAVAVERRSGGALMSGFHGLFSVGALAGAAGLTALLTAGAPPLAAAALGLAVVAAAIATALPRLLPPAPGRGQPMLAVPRGAVLLIGCMAFAAYLLEGAMLDWGAVFLVQVRSVRAASAGIGYALFSATMTAGRLAGDRLVAALGPERVLTLGSLGAAAGLGWVLLVPAPALGAAGFALIGLSAANIVPVLFSAAGRQRAVPEALAIAAMSTLGYAGVLAGPALIGMLARGIGLPRALALPLVLLLLIPLGRQVAAR